MTDLQKSAPPAPASMTRARRKNSIGEKVKELIIEQDLQPGDRLPAEKELMARFQASKGSVREALSALRSEGLIRTRTGPKGGVFLADMDPQRAMALLSNYFLFRTPSVTDIYAVRCELEPEMAASVAGRLTEEDFAQLERTMRIYDAEPETAEEEYEQRMAELDFHGKLAALCPNPVLGLFCGFLQTLLRETVVCKRIYDAPHPDLRDTGLHYQIRLLRALRAGNGDSARQIMAEHMAAARDYMVRMEADIVGRFL